MKTECKCKFIVHIILRYAVCEGGPKYCVEAICKIHNVSWLCLTDDLKIAEEIGMAFPVVSGGVSMCLSSGSEAFPIPKKCIISMIPKRAKVAE